MACGCNKKAGGESTTESIAIKKAKEYAVKKEIWVVVYRCKGGDVDLMPMGTFQGTVGEAIAYLSPY